MRAVFSEIDFSSEQEHQIEGDKAHHLIKVVRIKEGEKFLALNGKGKKSILKVLEVNKRDLRVSCESSEVFERDETAIDLFVCKVKKDAMDLVLKSSVELGAKSLYIGSSDFSQKYDLNHSRLNKLVESALEQSNNLYKLEV